MTRNQSFLSQQIADLKAENLDLRERSLFMLNATREAQTLCAAAQESARSRGDKLSGAALIKPAFRAFEIADAAMFVDLDSFAAYWDENGIACTVVDSSGDPTADLNSAGVELREAVEWLKLRGYVDVVLGDDNALHVIVRERPEVIA